jgi:hypothetical protein
MIYIIISIMNIKLILQWLYQLAEEFSFAKTLN